VKKGQVDLMSNALSNTEINNAIASLASRINTLILYVNGNQKQIQSILEKLINAGTSLNIRKE